MKFEKSLTPEECEIHFLKKTCKHKDRIQSIYAICNGILNVGYVLCLACAIEKWPNPEERQYYFRTEIGYVGCWTYHIVVDTTVAQNLHQ